MSDADGRPPRPPAVEGQAETAAASRSREESFARLLRLASRDARGRSLVAAVIEGTTLRAHDRAAILRHFLRAGRGPSEPSD